MKTKVPLAALLFLSTLFKVIIRLLDFAAAVRDAQSHLKLQRHVNWSTHRINLPGDMMEFRLGCGSQDVPGVCLKAVDVLEGEMVELKCPFRSHGDAKPTWTNHTAQEMMLTNNLSSVEERQMLIHPWILVILNVSVYHQGNYSCSLGNTSRRDWTLLVTRDPQKTPKWPKECSQGESCTLQCHVLTLPTLTNITNLRTTCQKDDGSLPTSLKDDNFRSVDEKDRGVYTCTSSYRYYGRLYNITCRTDLNVEPTPGRPFIISPRAGDVFHVDLDSPVVIPCTAVLINDIDDVYWSNGTSRVATNNKLSVYFNTTQDSVSVSPSGTEITASLVFTKVSEKDLSKHYTCVLQSTSNVTISLARKTRPFSVTVVLCVVGVMVVVVVTLSVIYVRLKIDITLFLRDSLGCHSSTSDGKSYDAYLMCYKSDTESTGLNEEDKRWLEKVLEEEFGYNLCIYDRDVLPGEAVADAVLGCVEQSRRVVLIPSSSDPGTGCELLSAVHTALVERQTCLVLIRPETTAASHSGPQPESSLPEALQLFGKAGHSVTWRGPSSQPLSSSFWKHLRYHLPAPQHHKPVVVPTDNHQECQLI